MSKFRKNQWIFHVISVFLGVSLLNHSQSTQHLIPNPAQSRFFRSVGQFGSGKNVQKWRPFAAPDPGEKDTKGNNGERGILIVTNLRSADASHWCHRRYKAVILNVGGVILEPRMMYFWRNLYSFFFLGGWMLPGLGPTWSSKLVGFFFGDLFRERLWFGCHFRVSLCPPHAGWFGLLPSMHVRI